MKTEIVARLTDGRLVVAEDIQPAVSGLLGTGSPAVCLEQAGIGVRTSADIIVPVSSLLFYYRREADQEGDNNE